MHKIALFLSTWLCCASVLDTGAALAQTHCQGITGSPKPIPIYESVSGENLLKIQKKVPQIKAAPPLRTAAPAGNHYFLPAQPHGLRLSVGKSQDLLLQVPDFQHRPLTGRWINAKLLYLELWVNPHSGFYWILDTQQEKVLFHETMEDGLALWQTCNPSRKAP